MLTIGIVVTKLFKRGGMIMTQQQLQETALEIMNTDRVGIMATVANNKPYARYMTFFYENGILFTITHSETHKIEEILQNPFTHILLGYEGEGFGDAYVEIEGNVTVTSGDHMIEKLWNDHVSPWFNGPDDPDLLVLEIRPQQIRLLNKKGLPPQVIDLDQII